MKHWTWIKRKLKLSCQRWLNKVETETIVKKLSDVNCSPASHFMLDEHKIRWNSLQKQKKVLKHLFFVFNRRSKSEKFLPPPSERARALHKHVFELATNKSLASLPIHGHILRLLHAWNKKRKISSLPAPLRWSFSFVSPVPTAGEEKSWMNISNIVGATIERKQISGRQSPFDAWRR